MRRGLQGGLVMALFLVVVVGSLVTPGLVSASLSGDGSQSTSAQSTSTNAQFGGPRLQTGNVESDGVVLRANVSENGDARWTVEYRIRLTDENTTEAFRSLQQDIENNESQYASTFERRITATVGTAENATGREMAVENVSVTTRVQELADPSIGFVVYSFKWTNFARTESDRLVVGDAIEGFFLNANTTLEIAWPPGYEPDDIAPMPDSRPTENSVRWNGERDFGPNQPRVVLTSAGAFSIRPARLVAGLLILAVLGAVLYRFRGRIRRGLAPGSPGDEESSSTSGQSRSDAQESGTGDEAPPEDLLSPQERVLRLVRENGGRMKQAEVTEEFGWSAARTSQVVGDLRDEGKLESFRLGRENVLRLPSEDDDLQPEGGPESDSADGSDGITR